MFSYTRQSLNIISVVLSIVICIVFSFLSNSYKRINLKAQFNDSQSVNQSNNEIL